MYNVKKLLPVYYYSSFFHVNVFWRFMFVYSTYRLLYLFFLTLHLDELFISSTFGWIHFYLLCHPNSAQLITHTVCIV